MSQFVLCKSNELSVANKAFTRIRNPLLGFSNAPLRRRAFRETMLHPSQNENAGNYFCYFEKIKMCGCLSSEHQQEIILEKKSWTLVQLLGGFYPSCSIDRHYIFISSSPKFSDLNTRNNFPRQVRSLIHKYSTRIFRVELRAETQQDFMSTQVQDFSHETSQFVLNSWRKKSSSIFIF